jgi:hypothetical protein
VPSAYFYATLHFIVTAGVLVWLYRRHPDSYRTARQVLVIATVACLVGFWLCPTAPPRLMPGSGIRDTLADVHQGGWWAGPSSGVPVATAAVVLPRQPRQPRLGYG